MSWLDKEQISIYNCMADNQGRVTTFRNALFTQFAVPHEWFYKDFETEKWVSGESNDLRTMIKMRTTELTKKEKLVLKSTMQCFTPAAALKTKRQGEIEVLSRTNLMQLDFDYEAIKDYEIDELKQAVFALAFIAFCGLSCSGNGFYALALIAEPDKLKQYAEHCFKVLSDHGIPPDTTKGRNINDLRFVSYDANMLIRDNPVPLRIKQFKKVKQPLKTSNYGSETPTTGNDLVNKALQEIGAAIVGTRWSMVQKWSYTLGGLNDRSLLDQIKAAIKNSSSYNGEEAKYYECAEACFNAGIDNPLKPA